jgi:hypothetical protein
MMTFFWKLTGNGRYSSKSAHEVKFLGGKFGLLLRNFFFRLAPNAKSDLDRPWTVYKSGVGQIMACGLFASKRRNRFATFFVNCRYTALI